MKCMNPKCDSEDFELTTTQSLTDDTEEIRYWVSCSECLVQGPSADTIEEAKSYFEDEYAEMPSENLSTGFAWETSAITLDDLKQSADRLESGLRDIWEYPLAQGLKTRDEAIAELKKSHPISEYAHHKRVFYDSYFQGLEKQKPKTVDFFSSWIEQFNDQMLERLSIPKEVLEMDLINDYLSHGLKTREECEKELKIMKPLCPGPTYPTWIQDEANIKELYVKPFDVASGKINSRMEIELDPCDNLSFTEAPIGPTQISSLDGVDTTPREIEPGVIAERMRKYDVKITIRDEIDDFVENNIAPDFTGTHKKPMAIFQEDAVSPDLKEITMTAQGHIDTEKYPHKCDCGAPAWRGLDIQCSDPACLHYKP